MSIMNRDPSTAGAAGARANTTDPSARALSFEGGTGYLLARTGSAARRRWARMLAERSLTPHHYGVLMALDERGPLGQQQLSELVGIDPRNAVPIIDGLADRSLLARAVHPTDRRRRVVTLTKAGRAVVRDLTRTGGQIERQFLRALDPAERAELHRMLLALLASDNAENAPRP